MQETLENALSLLLSRPVNVHGCGRTDSGVHAQKYFAHLDLEEIEGRALPYRLNRVLPADIQVSALIPVHDRAHAQKDALSRTYQYQVHRNKNPFIFPISYWFPFDLNIDQLNEISAPMINTRDFRAFTKTPGRQQDFTCQILEATWIQETQDNVVFRITGDHFLRGMIRILVGNLLAIYSGKSSLQEIYRALEEGIRPTYFHMAPPHGLHLIDIKYPYLH